MIPRLLLTSCGGRPGQPQYIYVHILYIYIYSEVLNLYIYIYISDRQDAEPGMSRDNPDAPGNLDPAA